MPASYSSLPVAILMATYNGQRYLKEQLDSIAAQSYTHWRLWVSDDGSGDGTLDILSAYREQWGPDKLSIFSGPRQGFQANFISLTDRPEIEADYFAWSDQDDLWLPDKLERAVAALRPHGPARPALYCGRSLLVDSDNKELGYSPLHNRRPPSFRNALLQCLAGGNTMIFNRPARELIRLGRGLELSFHDWWAYLLISGAEGAVIYDPAPGLRYRQHGRNLMGENISFGAKFSRFSALLHGRMKAWNHLNIKALSTVSGKLTAPNRALFEDFKSMLQNPNPFVRLRLMRKAGLYRQTGLGQTGIYLALTLGRL